MSADLESVLDAYRAENAGEGLDRARIERRIVASLAQRRARGRRRLWVVPLGMGLLGSVALAATVGPMLWREPAGVPEPRDTPASTARSVSSPSPPEARPASEAERGLEPLSPSAGERGVEPLPAEPMAPSPRLAPTHPSLRSAPPPRDTTASLELAEYTAARRLQVDERNPRAALRAWDIYLQRFPAGALHVEARFNRVRCLLELGESHEARQSLRPLAAGAFGPQRQSQALTLLQALDERER